MPELRDLLIVAVVALVTALLRFFPFLIFNGNRKIPKTVEKLGRILPFAVMGMLVIYCLKDIRFTSLGGFLPALIASVIVGALYVWKRSTLLSIVSGTVCYMILVQVVF